MEELGMVVGGDGGGSSSGSQQPVDVGGGGADPSVSGRLKPVLQNIVATCNLAVEVDLKTIALHARNAEYNPKRFSAVIMRIREPKTTALIFRSGKMVVTGAKSEEHARNAARKYARIIQKLDFPVHFTDFKIQASQKRHSRSITNARLMYSLRVCPEGVKVNARTRPAP